MQPAGELNTSPARLKRFKIPSFYINELTVAIQRCSLSYLSQQRPFQIDSAGIQYIMN